jgi:hypothetical protein
MAHETAEQLRHMLERAERRERDLGMENARLRRENDTLRNGLGMTRRAA